MNRNFLIIAAMILSLAQHVISQELPPTNDDCRLVASGVRNHFRILPPEDVRKQLRIMTENRKSGSPMMSPSYTRFTINFIGSWDPDARIALQYACDIWSLILHLPQPVRVNATWSLEEEPTNLASCWAAYLRTTTTADSFWYRYPLYEAKRDTNNNGTYPDMHITVNGARTDWHFGIDGDPAGDEYDFVTVALHEVCHGLGFAGTMKVVPGGTYGDATFDSPGNVYELWTYAAWGAPMIALPQHGDQLAYSLTHGGVYFYRHTSSIGKMLDGMGYGNAELYAPNTWEQGSSFSHLDENFNNTPAALMTYSGSRDEAIHWPGYLIRGIMQSMGWRTHRGYESGTISTSVSDPWGVRLMPGASAAPGASLYIQNYP